MNHDMRPSDDLEGGVPSKPLPLNLNDKVQQLVGLSLKFGYVTVQQISHFIPDSATDPEVIENVMNILDSLDVKILDDDEVESFRKKLDDQLQDDEVDVRGRNIYDPFEIYFKQLGDRPVLTRDQERDLFSRLEELELRTLKAIFTSSVTLEYQLEIAARLYRREARYDKVVSSKLSVSQEAYLRVLPEAIAQC